MILQYSYYHKIDKLKASYHIDKRIKMHDNKNLNFYCYCISSVNFNN